MINNNCGKGGSGGIWGVIIGYVIVPTIMFIAGYVVRKKLAPVSSVETVQSAKENFDASHSWVAKHPEASSTMERERRDIMEEPYLLIDKLIHLRETVVIYSKPGLGKTFLACFIAKTAHPRKTTYFALDDQGSNQLERIRCIPNAVCIGYDLLDKYLEEFKEITRGICSNRAFFDFILKDQSQIQSRKEKLMKELGVYEQEKIDKLFIFELLIESSLCSDSEIFILDSLNALLDYEFYICRSYINRITRYCREAGKTLIMIHHANKKKEIAGHSSLSQTVDLVLKLDGDPDNLLEITVEKSRYLQGCRSCYLEMISEGNNSVRFEYRGDISLIQKTDLTPLEYEIIDALGDKDNLLILNLYSLLGNHNKGSILNSLKSLEEKGKVAKSDGKTWKIIKNCKDNNTVA
jgi:hypothetical protein